jgi:hypothetical protein
MALLMIPLRLRKMPPPGQLVTVHPQGEYLQGALPGPHRLDKESRSWLLLLSTEYRYILAIHYFVVILAALTLCTAASWCYRGAIGISRGVLTTDP